MKDNLLKKLMIKLKNSKKQIVGVALAGGIALSGLAIAQNPNCSSSNLNIFTNSDSQSGGNSETNSNNSKYSQILQNVMTDIYYRNAISMDNSISSKPPFSFNNHIFDSIPYGFLEDEGYDIDAIKNGKLYCSPDLYTIGNDLFIALRVANKTDTAFWSNNTSYLSNYIIKYELTDQELKEMDALFTPLSRNPKTTYYQAPFFVQELSYNKVPEIISLTYTTLDSLKAIESRCISQNFLSLGNYRATYLGVEDIGNSRYKITYQMNYPTLNQYQGEKVNFKSKLYTVSFIALGSDGCVEYDNKPIQIGTSVDRLDLTDENKQKALESVQDIHIYSASASYYKKITDKLLEEELSK